VNKKKKSMNSTTKNYHSFSFLFEQKKLKTSFTTEGNKKRFFLKKGA